MIQIFYKEKEKIEISHTIDLLDKLSKDAVVWIDIVNPDGKEKRSVETFLNISLSSRAHAEEIESSSRYFETDNDISVNTDFMISGPDSYSLESVSFVLCGNVIVSIHQVELRNIIDVQRKLQVHPSIYPTGYHIFLSIIENRVDLDADTIELMAKEIDIYSRKISSSKKVNEEFLLDINQLLENTMLVRENVVDKQRMVSFMMKSDKFPKDIFSKLEIINNDIVSLLKHTNFNFERLDYLQNTVLGLINLDQNHSMNILTFVSFVLMPPTLIASIYGMNIKLPRIGGAMDFILLAIIMALMILIEIIVFKKKKMI